MYMLDTNICMYIIKKRPASVYKQFEKYIKFEKNHGLLSLEG